MDKRIRRISRALAGKRLGKPLFIFEVVDSTNVILKRQADAGAPEGYTVIADQQTQGRGRMGSKWLSMQDKGLYMSVLLRPKGPVSDSVLISMLSVLAVARALEQMGISNVMMKWPNDVLANGRKIAGILVEPGIRCNLMDYAVVGIGVNVSHDEEDFQPVGEGLATSCRMEGIHITCDDMLIHVLNELDACYDVVQQGNRSWIVEEWARRRVDN